MGTLLPVRLAREAAPDAMLFMSGERCISASGIAERIAIPVDPDGQGDAHFQRQVAAALARARAGGVERPIVMGAIPFDVRQPASLAIPLSYRTLARAQLPAVPSQAAPHVVMQRSVPGEARFKQAVRQAIANFAHSDICKAVLSRMLEVELSAPLDGASLFARLSEQNASGYHFRLPLADGSELIGVSPELLLRKQDGRIYSNPLAGSARRQPDPVRDAQAGSALLASIKDNYEHRLVIDDIARVLAPLCRELNVPEQASLLGTAAMWHLSTRIDGVPADPALGALELACRLHPTPAVCGYPTVQARKLIDLVEPFERGLFTGMVGWADADGNGEWAVTIRCGRLHERRITLFAGAGIVADSQPDAEWAETEAKLQTMLRALGIVDAPAALGAAA